MPFGIQEKKDGHSPSFLSTVESTDNIGKLVVLSLFSGKQVVLLLEEILVIIWKWGVLGISSALMPGRKS